MPPSSALLGGFAIGARVALLWQHNANGSYNLAFVSDIAVFVLKSDVKLQPTNQPTNQQACLHLAIWQHSANAKCYRVLCTRSMPSLKICLNSTKGDEVSVQSLGTTSFEAENISINAHYCVTVLTTPIWNLFNFCCKWMSDSTFAICTFSLVFVLKLYVLYVHLLFTTRVDQTTRQIKKQKRKEKLN